MLGNGLNPQKYSAPMSSFGTQAQSLLPASAKLKAELREMSGFSSTGSLTRSGSGV